MTHTKPSELEMQVLSVLWQNGPCTARKVLELLPDKKKRAYTTVLSIMQMMEKKNLLTHQRKGNANLYRPLQDRETIVRPFISRVVSQVFGGSRLSMVESLLGTDKLNKEELEQLRTLIDRYTQEN